MEMRDIEGFSNYKISDDGRVWSKRTQKWLKSAPNTAGYQRVILCVDGKLRTKYVHRLVAEAFLPNLDNFPEVNHKNEIKTDNRVENLEWCDHKYNCNYGTRNERVLAKCHTKEHNAKIKATQQQRRGKPVVQLLLDDKEVARFCSTAEAARQTGFFEGNISNACTGRYKTYKGYKWVYIES